MTLGLNIKPEHNLEEIDVVELYFVPVDNLLKIIESIDRGIDEIMLFGNTMETIK